MPRSSPDRMFVSFWLRFDGAIPDVYAVNLKYYIAIALAVKLTILLVHDMYDVSWRFFGLKDLLKLFSAVTLSSLPCSAGGPFLQGFRLLSDPAPFRRLGRLPAHAGLDRRPADLQEDRRRIPRQIEKDVARAGQGPDRRGRRRRKLHRPGHAGQQEIQVLSGRLYRRQSCPSRG